MNMPIMPCNGATSNNAIVVPTKQEDNCSYASFMPKDVDQEGSKFDAFEHYSSDLLRFKALLLSSDEQEDDDELNNLAAVNGILRSAGLSNISANHISKDDAPKRRRGNNSQPLKEQKESGTSRKTRLSWELHPSLILHELYQVEECTQSISDDEEYEDAHKTKSNEQRMQETL